MDEFKILEKRLKRTKGEIDNYYFEITKDDITFSIQTKTDISSSQQVIKEVKYFNDGNYICILPITKDDGIISDILCEKDGIYYNYNSLVSKDSKLDEFASDLSKYRDTFNESDEKPGVSAINPPFISNSSTNLVVCLPLPRASDTSPVFKSSDASILFKRELFPAPV